MLCNNCKNKSICRHYYYVNSNLDLEIVIKKCKNHIEDNKCFDFNYLNEEKGAKPTQFEPCIPPKDIPLGNTAPVESIRTGYPDFKSEDDIPQGLNVKSIEVPMIECPTCNFNDYETNTGTCSICKSPTCGNCSIIDYNEETNSYETVCETCWSGNEIKKADPNSKAKISYSAEEDTWDIGMFKDKESEGDENGNKRTNKKSKK